jgi:16S rRNA (guanine966-N2)-methyltransferase
LRIIAGKFRGRRLASPAGSDARPTSDRLRETLFNILGPRVDEARFLDLCAGTGAIGIEALSRGASHVTFIDQSRKMCEVIETNLASLEVAPSEYEIIVADGLDYLGKYLKQNPTAFHMIFFDPPYATDYEAVLRAIGESASQFLTSDGIVIVEHYKKKPLPADFHSLSRYRELKQGDSVLSFYRRG